MEACAYRRPGFGRDRVPTALRLGLEIKGLFGSAGNQALVPRNQEMGSINSSAEGQAGCRSVPSTHGYLVYAGRGKGSVLSRVPTHFRPESPPLAPKKPLLSIRRLPGTRPNMPTDRKLGPCRTAAAIRRRTGAVRSYPQKPGVGASAALVDVASRW